VLGNFGESPGDYQMMVASESAGTWGSAEKLTAPSGSSGLFVASGISCGAVGSCAVGGSYVEEGGINRPVVAEETGGIWGAVTPLSLPANVSSTNSHSAVESISCAGEGTCTAVGNYEDNIEEDRAFSARETGGTWTLAEQILVPGAPEPESPYHEVGLHYVDCVSAESCGAIGFAYFRGVTLLMEGGSWGAEASSIMWPPNSQSEESGALESLSCGAAGSCSAVGTYTDGEGASRAMALDTEGAALAQHTLEVAKAGSGSGAVMSQPAGIDCGSTCSHSFDEGSTVTLTALPASGSTFTGWSGACSGTGSCEVTMGGDKAVTASFALKVGTEEEHHELPAGGGPTPTPTPTPVPTPAPPPTARKNPLKCRKGFQKRKVHGKARCVKARKPH
jgi:hypothetical protein